MAFFLPRELQKRLFRSALSQLSFLDIDALDLDKLEGAWGRKSTVEIRDIPFKVDKLAELLALPDGVVICRAKVIRLKLSVPMYIWNQGIEVEIDGVEIACGILYDQEKERSLGVGTKAKQPRSTQPRRHDPGGQQHSVVPSVEAMAQSFMDNELEEDKRELVSRVAKHHNLEDSQMSQSSTEDLGVGAELSFLGMMTDFLWGVGERLKIRITDLRVEVALKLALPTNGSLDKSTDHVTLRFTIDSLEIWGSQANDQVKPEEKSEDVPSHHRLNIQNVQGFVVSDALFFDALSTVPVPSPPSTTHASAFQHQSSDLSVKSALDVRNSPSDSQDNFMSHSTIFDGASGAVSGLYGYDENAVGSRQGQFSGSDESVMNSRFQSFGSEGGTNQFEDYSSPDQSFLENGQLESADKLRDQLQDSGSSIDAYGLSDTQAASITGSTAMSSEYHSGEPPQTSDPLISELLSRTSMRSEPSAAHEPNMEGSDMGQSIFHEFGSSSSSEQGDHTSALFHDTMSRAEFGPPGEEVHSNPSQPNPDADSSLVKGETGLTTDILMESTLFTHEEAQSMYQSAVSGEGGFASNEMPLPGRWSEDEPIAEASTEPGPSHVLAEHQREQFAGRQFRDHLLEESESRVCRDDERYMQDSDVEGHSSERSGESETGQNMAMCKRFFQISAVSIYLPLDLFRKSASDAIAERKERNVSQNVKTTFGDPSGADSDQGAPRASFTATPYSDPTSGQRQVPASPLLTIERVELVNDMAMTKLAVMLAQQSPIPRNSRAQNHEAKAQGPNRSSSWQLRIRNFNWTFANELKGQIDASTTTSKPDELSNMEVLLITKIADLAVTQRSRDEGFVTEIDVGQYTFGYADEDIISFDSSVKMRESVRDVLAPTSKDIFVKIVSSPSVATDITIMTLPVHIVIDLRRLDEAFSWFGGFSSMIGLGNSVISTTTITDTKTSPRAMRVRFDMPATNEARTEKLVANSQVTKFTSRIGGVLVQVLGKCSGLKLEGSALKIVHRPEGLGMKIDRLRFAGPVIYGNESSSALSLDFGPLGIEYAQTPKEHDLTRLLALLSPSGRRDETEQDDDVLIDTLLRQRRKGGLLRFNIDLVTGHVHNINDLEQFSVLADEMRSLATMTKYLPEDDRPGMMVLSLVKEIRLEIEVSPTFGALSTVFHHIDLAVVTMPYLLLLGIDKLGVFHDDKRIVGEVITQNKRERQTKGLDTAQQQMPMVLAKFIGNEMEPTMKLRLWNLCVDYYVATVMSALGISEGASREAVIAEIVHSVASLTPTRPEPNLPSQQSAFSEKSTGQRPMNLDVGFCDCVVGLNPLQCTAKGLFVLSEAKISGVVPRHQASEVSILLVLQKASFMCVNDAQTLRLSETLTAPDYTQGPIVGRQILFLTKMGYVQTAQISSAKIAVRITRLDDLQGRTVDIDIRDELFVIDSCADSTQTIALILSGLAPPMPPSTDIKYRTEVESIEDMLASFTGDAFPTDKELGNSYERIERHSPEDEMPFQLDEPVLSEPSTDSPELARQLGFDVTAPSPPEVEKHPGGPVPPAVGKPLLGFADTFYHSENQWDGVAFQWTPKDRPFVSADSTLIQHSPLRVRVRDVHLIWNLFDGYDWQHTRDVIGNAISDVERRAVEKQTKKKVRRSAELDEEEDSVIGDFLFNSIYIGVGARSDPRELTRQVNRNLADDFSETDSYATPTTVTNVSPRTRNLATRRRRLRLERSRHKKMAFELRGLSADVVVFPQDSGETQMSLDLRVHDIEIFDEIRTSTWKKFATYMHDHGERVHGLPMAHIQLLNVKPVPELAASELVVNVRILPLRLHVDQDALDFLTRFFEFKDTSTLNSGRSGGIHEQPFLQRVEVHSIPVKLDFKPKRVDYAGIRSGKTTEFMNFVILEEANLTLNHVIVYGISGFERLGTTLNDIWMPDVKRNQLPLVLAGLAPVRGIVNVGSGVKDLVVVPMREYRKDGRLVRAIQKGAAAFAKTTTTELAKLGARLALGTQTVLENAEDILSGQAASEYDYNNPGTSAGADDDKAQKLSPYADQPLGVLAGVRGAYKHMERDLLFARDAIIAIPGEIRESGSAEGAARAILRNAPTLILRPAIGVTRAAGTALMGAANALDKQERRRVEDKYKRY